MITNLKYINQHKVLIQFGKEESAEKIINFKFFNENGFRCQRTQEISQSGVIRNIANDPFKKDNILESLFQNVFRSNRHNNPVLIHKLNN